MNWFKNLKTAAKLWLGFGILLVLLATAMLAGYRATVAMQAAQERVIEHAFTGVATMIEVRADLNLRRARMLELTLSSDRAAQEAMAREFRARITGIDEGLSRVVSFYASNTSFLRRLEELRNALVEFRQTRDELINRILEGTSPEARATQEALQVERFEKISALALELGGLATDAARAEVAASGELAGQSVRVFGFVGVLALVVSMVVTTTSNRLISRPLVEVAQVAERVAAGDLTVNVSADSRKDEVGLLMATFGRMTVNLRRQIGEIVEGASVLGSAASEIVASTAQLASSAGESAAAVGETTTTVEEVRQTAQVASQKARYVSDSAQKAAQIAQAGRKSTEEVGVGVNRIRQQMEAIATSMVRLSEQTQAIGLIIATVEDLAAQSNLLAVNAGIEAAKAGEHGKGFGVVAQEVRSLAEQSRQATTQVRTILNDIQKATGAAVMATEQGTKAVEAGERQTTAAGESIQALANGVTEAAQAATQIAASSQQQLVGVDQVAVAMENIKQASAQNVASARQLETAARNLDELGRKLRDVVARYRVPAVVVS